MDPRSVKNVSVVGLGKLGAPLATCYASRGFNVVGVDADPETVSAMNKAKGPVREPYLDEFLVKNAERLRATPSVAEAVSATDVTFVMVSTPSENDGSFSLANALPVCRQIGEALGKKRGYHLVVVASTVSPGATENYLLPAVEEASGRRAGRDFGFCYSPEFVALGEVIHGFLRPDFALIGQFDERSGETLEAIQQRFFPEPTPVVRMNLVNAEVTKIALNTMLTTKISFANTIAQICERIPKADANLVTAAIGCDKRICGAYLKGATGFGGPCFPRDVAALRGLAAQVGVSSVLPDALVKINEERQSRLHDLVWSQVVRAVRNGHQDPVVAVLGLAFKPDSDVTIASAGVELVRSLVDSGVRVVAHDPWARPSLPNNVAQILTLDDCIAAADVIALVTPWRQYRRITPETFGNRPVIDCWGIYRGAECRPLTYVPMGVGLPSDSFDAGIRHGRPRAA
jgi:UDPglucose 6-dehydrogenase